ncbi:histidine kinase [Bacillus sp. FJAT-29814]|uniref:sensor histidine kinase n=1 Tax=Bacillus sp. FJAT-29814 TaxID=1729688 RepID=UPI000829939C|nr:histidine kinase [Bacillus sp. FJAT-29814]
MNKIKEYFHFSIIQRTILLSSISIILIGTVLTAASYYIQGKLMTENLDKQARGVAQMAFNRFDLQDIKEIQINHDLHSDVHQKILKELTDITKQNPNIAQVVLVDIGVNEKDESMALAIHQNYLDIGMRPGDMVEQNPIFVKLYKEIAVTGEMKSSGIYRDMLGEWSSILIPFKDENGKVIAMFVMDMSASEIREDQFKVLSRLVGAFAILLILSITIQTLALKRTLSPLKFLLNAVKELGQGNFSIRLNINRKDDLGRLAEGFNTAVTNIKSLISKVITTAQQVSEDPQKSEPPSETEHPSTDELIQTAINQMNMIEDNYSNLKVFSRTLEQYSNRIEELTLLEERRRLSKDMHDTVGHVFTAIITSLDALPYITDKEEANKYIQELSNLARKGLADLRHTIHTLPLAEKEQSFLESCTDLVDDFIKHTGTEVEIQIDGQERALGDLVKSSLIRCLQESLTNAIRHGRASQIFVSIRFLEDAIQMVIKDNGIGNDEIKYGFGLSSMSDRMLTVGGTFSVQSSQKHGTAVTCTVPVPKQLQVG